MISPTTYEFANHNLNSNEPHVSRNSSAELNLPFQQAFGPFRNQNPSSSFESTWVNDSYEHTLASFQSGIDYAASTSREVAHANNHVDRNSRSTIAVNGSVAQHDQFPVHESTLSPGFPDNGNGSHGMNTFMDAVVATYDQGFVLDGQLSMTMDPFRDTHPGTGTPFELGYDTATGNCHSDQGIFADQDWTNNQIDSMSAFDPTIASSGESMLASSAPIIDTQATHTASMAPAVPSILAPVALHRCTITGCNKSFKRDFCRRRHEATHRAAHGHHFCTVPGCSARYKRADKLTENMWKKHGDLGYVKAW
ncbi:uncharacterized protein PAC_14970 [Phialocephala subalpina]|uniref:C2H2-type domain-containing protein n=1 Tax=Phialocephala subalpina TaxID=576137 RepID=A0A1L7XJ52_9HELO|nr:uncharacterized protein PAC_14970 [Phialocephala subalpina]